MSDVKATDVVAVKKILRDKGPDLESKVLAKLNPAVAEIYDRATATQWIAAEHEGDILTAAAQVLFPGAANGIRELGRAIAKNNMSTFYKAFLRIPSVDFILARVAQLWRMNLQKGTVTVLKNGEKTGILKVYGYPDLLPSQSEEIAGYICGILDMTKAHNPRVTFKGEDPDQWEWVVAWD